jgi:pyruvate dehydrogenase E1 component alpha subunit
MVRGMKMKSLLQYWGGDERGHADKSVKNILPISIPISTQDVHAVGIAMAMQYKGEKNAVLVHMGDGGTSEGDFHEALNFAGVFQAPVVFLVTNNQWAISVPRSRQTHAKTLAQKALAYGFEGQVVDGNDIFAVYKVISEALEKARKSGGPTLVECLTYRMGDHTTADDQKRYRSQKEVKKWEKKDPILRLQKHMIAKKIWNAKKEEQLQDQCVVSVSAAVKEYEEDPTPNPKDMFNHTFAKLDGHLQEQQQDLIDTMGDKVEKKVLEKIEGGFP